MKLAPLLLLAAVLTAYVGAAAAQSKTRTIPIYRCGPDGRDLRDSPCPANAGASASQLLFDQPSAGQAQASKDMVAADTKRANDLERARLKKEAEADRRNNKVVGIDGLKPLGPTPAAASAAKAQAPASAKSPKPPKPPKHPKPPTKTATQAG
ncbi:hypothetical protein [Roseateles sp.]|uniref:hypothetical protein n=1 Tax=Roseateles sp. TaxID=1971397 RepID=UPI00286C995B|nr:hypothetical protein [Roseateles sp.]